MSSIQALQQNSLSDFAFDIHFNAAVLTICSRVLPGGYDVSDAAPETYEELIAHLDAGGRMLVYSGGSEQTIYGDPEVNFAFRAWHDWCHWQGRYDFSHEGEHAACAMQGEHLVTVYGESPADTAMAAHSGGGDHRAAGIFRQARRIPGGSACVRQALPLGVEPACCGMIREHRLSDCRREGAELASLRVKCASNANAERLPF